MTDIQLIVRPADQQEVFASVVWDGRYMEIAGKYLKSNDDFVFNWRGKLSVNHSKMFLLGKLKK